jgi:hypothetical protein
VLLMAALMEASAAAHAITYYASPTGSDSNPGTNDQPFRSVARGVQAVGAGDTIILKDGTYLAHTPYGSGSTSGWLIQIDKSGAPGAPITLKAEHKHMAILDCGNGFNAAQTGCSGYISMNPSPAYWVLQDLVFTRAHDNALILNSESAAHDITVKGCRFEEIGRHVDNSIYGLDGVYANRKQYNLTFDGNTFHNIGRLSGHSMSLDHGLYLHSRNTSIINNVFYGTIAGWGVQTAAGFSGLIANNTFAFTRTEKEGDIMLWDADGAVTVRNNIFYYPPQGAGVTSDLFSTAGCIVDHNLTFGGTIGSVSGCRFSNNISGAPAFVEAGSDFHLRPGSPAIDSGASIPLLTDFDGVSRPQGKAIDIGAFEYPVARQ